jgi:hypothetical protein
LRIVQTQTERRDLVVALAGRRRQRATKPCDRFGIAVSVETNQVFGLFLQVVEIRPIGQLLHCGPPCIVADGPQYRLHKGAKRYLKVASGFDPSRGPGRGLHRRSEGIAGGHENQSDTNGQELSRAATE